LQLINIIININPTAMKVGAKSFKSLKDGRVLIEIGTPQEANLQFSSIRTNEGTILKSLFRNLGNVGW